MKRNIVIKLIIVSVLIATGFLIDMLVIPDRAQILEVARQYANQWWLILVLILIQAILFTFALAGSLFLWIVAPLYTPLLSAFILAAGGTIGGLGGYWFSEKLTHEWRTRIERSHAYRLLKKQDDFFALFALRVFPAFPHSVINYSSGILKLNLKHFIAAAALGISLKSYIYSNVIYNASSATSIEMLIDYSIITPLILLSALSLLTVFIKHKYF